MPETLARTSDRADRSSAAWTGRVGEAREAPKRAMAESVTVGSSGFVVGPPERQ
jgi:hypothetical protein